jgi:hypothetical protein
LNNFVLFFSADEETKNKRVKQAPADKQTKEKKDLHLITVLHKINKIHFSSSSCFRICSTK